jgi:hypothetical protein
MRIFATVAAGLLLGSSWTVAAADEPAVPAAQPRAAECLCVLPVGAGSVVASLEDIKGQVLVAGTEGYKPLKSRADLGIGDRVLMLGNSQAVLTGGATCRAQLGSGSMISVIAKEKKSACILQSVRVSPAAMHEAVDDEDDDDRIVFWWLGATGAAMGTAAALIPRDRRRDRDPLRDRPRDRPISP